MATSWQQSMYAGANLQYHNQEYTTTLGIAKQQTLSTTSCSIAQQRSDGLQLGAHPGPLQETWQPVRTVSAKTSDRPPRLTASTIRPHALDEHEKATGSIPAPPRLKQLPGPSQHPLLSLANPRYALPTKLVANFHSLGVNAIYPWQSSCLLGRGLLEGQQNLIYTAPTGGGKSLVADVLMLKRVVESRDKKALVVLPYVALVQEKLKWIRRLVEGVERYEDKDCNDLGPMQWKMPTREIRVAGFYGGSKSKLAWTDCDIAVCTIEKANSLVNTALEDGDIDKLGVVVLDELHMLDDEHRGYIMELMMTKLMCLQAGVQVIGMSATLSNPKVLADWLQAKFYISKYRPIPIEEHLVYDNCIYPTTNTKEFFRTASQLVSPLLTQKPPTPSHTIAVSGHPELRNPMTNAVVALAVDTAVAGYGALVFCNSRQGVQSMAVLISEAVPMELVSSEIVSQRMDLLASLQSLPGGYEMAFSKTVPTGVAFHHAGLTTEERELVAEAYDAGILKVMVATCSLAAGINLPARRVILNGARMGRELVGPAMLRQMRGRAGRKGKDEVGETFLCCQKEELEAVAELLEAELPAVVSCLTPEKRGIKRAVLEVIVTHLASSYDSVREYVRRSLLWQTSDHIMILQMLDGAITSLLDEGLIQAITDDAFAPTRLGCAIVASSLTPEDGLFVHADLRRALSSFVMNSELHIFYLFTPIPQSTPSTSLTSDISWPVFRTLLHALDEPSMCALQHIGISPATINYMANSGQASLKESTPEETTIARVYRRTYSTFALRDICNEIPIHEISLKYNLPRGVIQNLAQTCQGFAAGMIKFCQRMAAPIPAIPTFSNFNTATASSSLDPDAAGFGMLAVVLDHMADRLRAGARADLLEMAQVTFVKGRMARLLYESGFKGIRALAEADAKKDIVPIMMSVSGWKVKPRYQEDMNEYETRRKKVEEKMERKAEILVASAAKLWEREVLRQVIDEE